MRTVSIAAAVAVFSAATAAPLEKRAGISSCGSEWMPLDNVKTNHDQIERRGYIPAVDAFCDAAHGKNVKDKGYLTMTRRIWLNYGENPKTTGINGHVYFEFHNKGGKEHTIDGAKCKEYLKKLSDDGNKCRNGNDNKNGDTKGGTWQADEGSYHALGKKVPPGFEAVDQIVIGDGEVLPLGDGGKGRTLDPFPTYSFNDVVPLGCHSHNDYTRDTALYSALSAGCISVEADVRPKSGQLIVGHSSTDNYGTLENLYLNPLKKLLDERKAIFPGSPLQGFSLLIDFKGNADETWDLLVKQLQPLRDAKSDGYPYLSFWDDNSGFQEGFITIIASGNAIKDGNVPEPIAKVTDNNPGRAVFVDARINKDMSKFDQSNAYFASANYKDVVGGDLNDKAKEVLKSQINAAHADGKKFKVRYWDIPGNPDVWQELYDLGVDKINVDKLQDVAAVNFPIGKILP